jgi:LCP family protein required for cell wall assembly
MANLGCLRVVARLLLVVVGLVIIFFLGRSALDGIRDLSERAANRRAQEEQATAYPGIATDIAIQNATLLSGDVASAATGTPSEVEPTDAQSSTLMVTDSATAAATTESDPATAEPIAATTISTATDAPSETPTDAPTSTSTSTSTTEPTQEIAAPLIATTEPPTVAPSDTAVPTNTDVPPTETSTLTFTALPPTATDTDVPPTATNTETSTATFTATSTSTATETSTSTFTATVTPSKTAGRILIPTNTRRPALATNTPVFIGLAATETPTSIPPTDVPPTDAPTATVAVTPVPTQEPSPTLNSELVAIAPTATIAEIAAATATSVGELIEAPTLQATSTLPRVLGRDSCTDKPQPTAVPTSAPRLRTSDDVMNILLLGSDQDVDPSDPGYRTDVILIVSINRTTNTVSMLSLPRDLYLCIPQLGMNRINIAYEWGEAVGWSPGGGFGLMQETILYNTGIPIHYYARISLNGFKQVVDSVGGVDIAVECPIIDSLRWLGNNDENGDPIYEPFTLDAGYYHMDGSFALWYARTRKAANTGGTDFDRNRRQQQVLRAIWRTARDQGLIQKAPELWNQLTSIVDTNLNLVDALGLAPIALGLDPGDITTYYMFKGYELDHFKTPNNEDVQIPVPEAFFTTINNFYTPPSANRLAAENAKIEIYNGSGHADWDKMAADVIGYKGLVGSAMGATDTSSNTVIYDFTGGATPNSLNLILKAYGLKAASVINQPDPNRTVDIKIMLGQDFNACTAPGYQR